MREILFRGQTRRLGDKVKANGEKLPGNWVYGGIFPGTGDFSIIYGGANEGELQKHVVYSDTVGQYIGLHDITKWDELTTEEKNEWLKRHTADEWIGKLIFDGDIVHITGNQDSKDWKIVNYNALIAFIDGGFCALDGTVEDHALRRYGLVSMNFDLRVIGNIYDSPELLEV